MYVVMGATGHVGGSVARALLAAGESVTVVTRNAVKAEAWRQKGAQAAILDVQDTPALSNLFQKARRAFVLNPPASPALNTDVEERKTVQAILKALQGAGLEKIVLQSTYGAQPGAHCGDLGVLYEFEEGARQLGTPLCVVRAAYYMSNWTFCMDAVRASGALETFLPAAQKVPMVAPQDVGAVAAQLLRAPLSETGVYAVEGPERYSPEDVAEVLGEALNQSVRVASLPKTEWLAAYRRNGFSDSAAQSYAHMTEIFVTRAYDVPASPLKGPTDLKTYFQQVLAQNAA